MTPFSGWGVAGQAAAIREALGDRAHLVEAAAWLHDIGYAEPLVVTGFHSLDGARYLRDADFSDRTVWTLVAHHTCALVEAEEQGITSGNVAERLRSTDPNAQRLLGVSGGFGTMMGLSDRWAYEAVRQVGNYGEIFTRTLTPIGIDRGVNRLWNRGGLIYSPAMR